MKSTHYLIIATIGLLLYACSKDSPLPIDNVEVPCITEPLGITEEAMQLYPNQLVWFGFDSIWQWHRSYDTLTVKITTVYGDEGGQTRYMIYLIDDCITLIRDYDRHSSGLPYPGYTPAPIINDYDLNFQLQYWDEQKKIVGKNNDTEIWVEFTPDNMY